MTIERRRRIAWGIIAASLVMLLAGGMEISALIAADRRAVAANGIPPPRGAPTTLAGMSLGIGFAGLIGGIAGLIRR